MLAVLVRIDNITARSPLGYCSDPPNPPNAGMQNDPPPGLSSPEWPPYVIIVRCRAQAGGPLTARANAAGERVSPLAAALATTRMADATA
jgi:hypothetical protein